MRNRKSLLVRAVRCVALVISIVAVITVAPLSYAQSATDQSSQGQSSPVQPGEVPSSEEKVPEPTIMEQMAPALAPTEPNTMMRSISGEAKMNAAQSFMTVNPLSLRDMVNMMTTKIKVDEGLTVEDVVESMNLRANLLNLRQVGHNAPWKIMESISGESMPKVEILSYCDVMTMRDILDYSPEFVAFLPCRIAVIEDSVGDLWVVTLDWDVRWLDTSPNPNKMSEKLRQQAITIRESLQSIMEAGAAGDL